MKSMETAIDNMIEEIKKPVDPEINGSARKAELQSIKQTATCLLYTSPSPRDS